MRLAISVIGWPAEQDAAALELLSGTVDGLESAPTRLWGEWDQVSPEAARRWRAAIEERGLTCPAMQSLLFGVEGASITGGADERRRASEHLAGVGELAGACGARVAVFGSPGNRRRGDLSFAEAERRAREALLPAGEAFTAHGAAIGIEANPPEYGCDFLTTYAEVTEFVSELDHPGVVAHLDLGGLLLTGETPDLRSHPPAHVHLSTPYLAPFAAEPRDWHRGLIADLNDAGYTGWLSIEQRPSDGGLDDVMEAVEAARGLLQGEL